MAYFVTFEAGGAAAIDQQQPKGFDLAGALAHAHNLMFDGYESVTISDDDGHSISGDELKECCNDDKTLTLDLRAVPK
jgi:glycosyltransferase A (GT-A) superfamily protein (DUF2064 family)